MIRYFNARYFNARYFFTLYDGSGGPVGAAKEWIIRSRRRWRR